MSALSHLVPSVTPEQSPRLYQFQVVRNVPGPDVRGVLPEPHRRLLPPRERTTRFCVSHVGLVYGGPLDVPGPDGLSGEVRGTGVPLRSSVGISLQFSCLKTLEPLLHGAKKTFFHRLSRLVRFSRTIDHSSRRFLPLSSRGVSFYGSY